MSAMRVRFPWLSPLSDEHPQLEPLLSANVRALRLPWLSRFNPETLKAHLDTHSGMSVWVPRTGEYAIASPWRRRDEIAQLVEVTARKGKPALLSSLIERVRDLDCRLIIVSDEVWKADPKLYTSLGFSHLERIVFFQKDLGQHDEPQRSLSSVDFLPLTGRDLDLLLEIDHSSFPWLWWNSPTEFEDYMEMPGVRVSITWHEGKPVGYTSFTMYGGWAHLDRIAVVEGQQGRGLGAAQLHHTLHTMRQLGAASVHLSTQQNNAQSHRLYRSFGFRQMAESMTFYGKVLFETYD